MKKIYILLCLIGLYSLNGCVEKDPVTPNESPNECTYKNITVKVHDNEIDSLQGKWVLEAFFNTDSCQATEVNTSQEMYVIFTQDSLYGYTGINDVKGTYQINKSGINFIDVISTHTQDTPQGNKFLELIPLIQHYNIENNYLFLFSTDKKQVLIFKKTDLPKPPSCTYAGIPVRIDESETESPVADWTLEAFLNMDSCTINYVPIELDGWLTLEMYQSKDYKIYTMNNTLRGQYQTGTGRITFQDHTLWIGKEHEYATRYINFFKTGESLYYNIEGHYLFVFSADKKQVAIFQKPDGIIGNCPYKGISTNIEDIERGSLTGKWNVEAFVDRDLCKISPVANTDTSLLYIKFSQDSLVNGVTLANVFGGTYYVDKSKLTLDAMGTAVGEYGAGERFNKSLRSPLYFKMESHYLFIYSDNKSKVVIFKKSEL